MTSTAGGAGELSRDAAISILERMLVMRRFEEKVFELHDTQQVVGIIHVYIGQEGTGAAVLEAAGAEDLILSTHRNHGHVVGRGADLGATFAELMGKATGLLGGRGGSFHACDPTRGMLQTSAIVGGCPSLAVGAAYGLKQRGGGGVAIGFFGDSALEEGIAYEALNIAALWKLPAILVCENNSIGVGELKGDSYPRSILASERLSRIPEMLGIHTVEIANGANAAEVFEATCDARRRCLAGDGPVFIESPIVRWPGSQFVFPKSMGATDLEVAFGGSAAGREDREWTEEHDPLIRWAAEIAAAGHATKEQIRELDANVCSRIDAGAQFAMDSPFPNPVTATQRIFA